MFVPRFSYTGPVPNTYNVCQAVVERLEAQASEAGVHEGAAGRAPTRRVPLLQRAIEPTLEARLLRAGRALKGGAAVYCMPEALQAPGMVAPACDARK